MRYLRDVWEDASLPVNVFLVEHRDGLCLVDTGQTAAASSPDYFDWWYPFFRLARFELHAPDEVAAQLEAANIDLLRLRWIVLTHMHTDHIGGLGALPRTEILVSREEWEPAQGLGGRLRGYLPQRWPVEVQPRLVEFGGPSIGPFHTSHAVTADGGILIVPLPGHTRGHVGVLIRSPASGSFLCVGDAVIRADELPAAFPEIAAWCIRERITVLACHDDGAADALRASIPASMASK